MILSHDAARVNLGLPKKSQSQTVIEDGVFIVAGSVVTRDVPGRALVAGNPARVLKKGI